MNTIKNTFFRGKEIVRKSLFSEKNVLRDVFVTSLATLILAFLLFSNNNRAMHDVGIQSEEGGGSLSEIVPEEQADETILTEDILNELKMSQENTDMSQWIEYSNEWLGFSVKYPQDWKSPIVQHPSKSSNWKYRIIFQMPSSASDNSYNGFSITAYSGDEAGSLFATEEFPSLRTTSSERLAGECESIDGHVFETGEYPAEEIYIPLMDDCYESTLFFTFTTDEYTYNLAPQKKPGLDILEDQRREIANEMPEFLAIASTLKSVDITKKPPSQVPVKKVITAPKPAVFEVDSLGRKVCNKKHDKPGKSKENNNGKIHMDMECCLDPDEYPNPHCYYDPEKYRKYFNANKRP